MKTISHEEMLNKHIGKKGTPEREKFDAEVQAGVIAHRLKELRKQKNLTQEQLAKIVGINKAGISKIEKGTRNLTIETIIRVAEALGATVNFDIRLQNT